MLRALQQLSETQINLTHHSVQASEEQVLDASGACSQGSGAAPGGTG